MVAAGRATFDLHNDGGLRESISNAEHLLHLRRGARLEGNPRDVCRVELLHQLHGLLHRGNAGGNHHAVDGCSRRTRSQNRVRSLNLAAPLGGREVQRIELGVHPGLQQPPQGVQVLLQDVIGVLSPAGQLRPVPSVGGCGDDFRVHSGGGHPGEHNR